MSRIVFHVDLDYFFAQCEEVRKPSLVGKPIVVCVFSGRTADSGAVSTANYQARKFGVRSGMPIVQARKLLADVDSEFLPIDRDHYENMSANIMEILRDSTDIFEKVGIDEAYLDATNRLRGDFGQVEEFAFNIKQQIKREIAITCSIGVSVNKLVAKIASDFQKPDGLTVVRPNEIEGFLCNMPVGKLPGVGVKTGQRMKTLGVATIGDLAKVGAEKLVHLFGRTVGVYFYEASRGIDDEPVKERGRREQLSRMVTLRENTREMSIIGPDIERLAEIVHRGIVEEDLLFKTVGVIAIMENLSIYSKTRSLDTATQDFATIKALSHELFRELLAAKDNVNVRRIGVKVSGLTQKKGQRVLSEFAQ